MKHLTFTKRQISQYHTIHAVKFHRVGFNEIHAFYENASLAGIGKRQQLKAKKWKVGLISLPASLNSVHLTYNFSLLGGVLLLDWFRSEFM